MPKIRRRDNSAWVKRVAASYGRKVGDVAYVFCDDEEILRVNRQYLQHDYYTDIITFDYDEGDVISGDLFISLDTVRTNAEQLGLPYEQELNRVIIHGILHLCGINDKGPGEREIMEAAEKLFHPEHSVENTWLVMGILVFGLIVETVSLRVAIKEIKALNKDGLSLYRFLRESRHSEILIIFAEDSCAVLGLLIALGGTLLSHFTNNPFYDALSGVLIGLLLCGAALFLACEFYGLLIGESVTTKDLVRIKSAFNRAEVSRLINVKTIHLSPTDILVTAKIDLKPEFEAQASAIINDIERNMRADFANYNIFIYIVSQKRKSIKTKL